MNKAAIALLCCMLVSVGCTRREEPRKRREKPETVFSFADTNHTVSAEDIKVETKSKSVTADFNLDGLQDLAVIEGSGDGEMQVTVYIRKVVAREGEMEDLASYYIGGAIRPTTEGKIIGIMSRGSGEHTDLIILAAYTNAANHMYHFVNDGNTFSLSDQPAE